MDTLLPSDLTDPCVYLSHREKSCNVQKVSQLFISLDQLHELISEDPEKHAMKISSLLLWIAAKHPYVLENESWGKALPAEIVNNTLNTLKAHGSILEKPSLQKL